MVKKTLQEFGRVDILVNSAGASFAAHAMKLNEDGWDAIVRENMKPVFVCSKAVVESMIEHGGGSIINIASTDGLRSAISNAAYGAAKAGVLGLTMSLAVEWARYNIRVNAVAPGFIGMGGRPQQGGVAQPIERDPYVQGIFDRIPLKRAAKPEEIAGTVIYLASDAGGYTTGAMIVVDGGMTCLPG
jgi:NAD(P)-dependent dehydrogenase (short-subunit alcohol dehydrogenase family)